MSMRNLLLLLLLHFILNDDFHCNMQVTSSGTGGKILPALTRKDRGRFSVVVFERLETYLSLNNWNRQLLDKYCRDFGVGMVAFAQPDEILFNAQVRYVVLLCISIWDRKQEGIPLIL